MGRYDWPGPRDPRRVDRPRHRDEALRDIVASVSGFVLAQASSARAGLLGALTASDENLWVPVGPSATLEGQAGSRPRVTGRVRDLAVHPGGQRAYAATANGGVWYTEDAGAHWSPIGAAGSTPAGEAASAEPNSLVTTSLSVVFGGNADGSGDSVFVGTGERRPFSQGYPGDKAQGIGILRLARSLPDVLANPFINPWVREADLLAGAGVFALARDPANSDRLVAATSIGLFQRQVSGSTVTWSRVDAGPFDFEADDYAWCTDVVWAPAKGATPARLWVALVAPSSTDAGLWVSEATALNDFAQVALDDAESDARLGIAVHENDPSILYVLGAGPSLWRVDGKTARKVAGIPERLFGENDSSHHNLAVLVHPTDPNRVVLGGSAAMAEQVWVRDRRTRKKKLGGGDWSASLFRLTISGTPAADDLSGNFDAAQAKTPGRDPNTFIGNNVHPDVHALKYTGTPAGAELWVGCDGGVFRSRSAGDPYSFVARNNGIAVMEAGYVANHPTNDGPVIIGTQDNGAQRRVGNTVWALWRKGDGGGVAFHPTQGNYYLTQYTGAHWRVNRGGWLPPVMRENCSKDSKEAEDDAAAFYSDVDIMPGATPDTARVVIGTNRVWITENWNPRANASSMSWQTIPSGKDPREVIDTKSNRNDTQTDTFKGSVGQVRVVQWAGPPKDPSDADSPGPEDRILALCKRAVLAFERNPKTGKWKRHVVSRYTEKCGDGIMENSDIDQPVSDVLPAVGSWSDLARHNPSSGKHGSFYVAATGKAEFDGDDLVVADRMDTLWWYDGSSDWHPTGLRTQAGGCKAPALAVVVDPDDDNVVYVGTGVGVWKGVLSFPAGNPSWSWSVFSNGLPDARVHDLAFFRDSELKILRAALQSRGVWEVDLSATPTSRRRTYLRAHPYDARRRLTADLKNPDVWQGGPPSFGHDARLFPWHGSPDIRVRRAPGSPRPTVNPIGLLPWMRGAHGLAYHIWVLQTAMHATDSLVRPTGKWSQQFDERVIARRTALALSDPDQPIVDSDFWTKVVTTGQVFATPWGESHVPEAQREPTEADLLELVHHDTEWLRSTDLGRDLPVVRVDKSRYLFDVLVHHRHFAPVNASDVKVLLLRRKIDAASEDHGSTVAIGTDWKNAVAGRLSGASPPLPTGWKAVGMASPKGPVSARRPRAISFPVDFGADAAVTLGSRWLFLAVVSAASDPATIATLEGNTLEDLVKRSHHVAARLVYLPT